MHNPTIEEIERFAKRMESLLGEAYKVEANKEITNLFGFIKESFDLVVFENNQPLVAIEYTSYLYGVAYKIHKEMFYSKLQKLGIPYAIRYYGNEDDVYFYSRSKPTILFLSLLEAVQAIKSKISWGEKPVADEIFVESSFPNIESDEDGFDEYFRISNGINKLFTDENLFYDEKRGVVSFTHDAEDIFFRILLPDEHETEVCRYTSINSFFLTLQKKNHCMLSITCMNDKGELTYADKLSGNYIYGESDENVAHNNDCFILSCCRDAKSDDLTMWRLYGDDAQGCCIRYRLSPDKIDNQNFFFAPVSYGQDMNQHLQLEYVKALKKFKLRGWTFQFHRWHIWKHFFKSYLFKDEHEYRLLYISNENDTKDIEWIRDNTHGIVSRIKVFCFDNSEFPLTINEAIIGPKCPEQEALVTQLKYMNMKQKVIECKVRNVIRPSEIKDYR